MFFAASDPPAAAALTSRNSRREKLLFVMATPEVMFSACRRVSLSFVRHKQYALRCNIATRFNNPVMEDLHDRATHYALDDRYGVRHRRLLRNRGRRGSSAAMN